LKAFALLWLLALLWGLQGASLLGLALDPSGHMHSYAHGHPFVDARSWLSIPNTLDVLSNLPFLLLGIWGLCLLLQQPRGNPHWLGAAIFFTGLIVTALGSSFYHWHPDSWGLAIDRTGMAIAFAGLLGLAWYERTALNHLSKWMYTTLVLAMVSAWVPHLWSNIWPWVVLQFGGIIIVLVCSCLPLQKRGLGIAFFPVLILYALAKAFEASDSTIFELTQGTISGHSVKHILASLAALPVIFALIRSRQITLPPSAKLRVEEIS
jgi:hypothetical protein